MKVRFEKSQLSKALDTVQRAAQSKVTSNTNNGILISARDGLVTFEANDFSIGIKTSCIAEIEEPGDVVIAAPQMPAMIRLLPGDEVLMDKAPDENICHFKAGSAHYRFPTRDFDEFPPVTQMENATNCTIKCADFTELVNLTQFAAASEKQNPIFTGILFEIKDTVFSMAATNTHCLAAKDVTLVTPATAEGRFIVPSGVLSDVTRLLPEEDDATMEISWAKSHVAFTFGNTYFISNLISGEYPDYHRVIPTEFDTNAVFNRKELSEAISMVSPISRDVNYNTVNFDLKDNMAEIYAEDADIGGSRVTIPVEITGSPISIVFNCTYIEAILKHSKGDTVTFHFRRNGAMLVEQEEDKNYKFVVTPMRGR